MNRFNLTFRGEIVEGHDPEQVQTSLGELLAIEDPALLERCFSGDPVVLRRNLERKEAAELYARLRRMGIHVDLVKIGERGDLHAGEADTSPASSRDAPKSDLPPAKPAPAKAEAKTRSKPTREAVAAEHDAAAEEGQDTGRNWPRTPAVPAGGGAAAAGSSEDNKGEQATRRADLAANRELHGEQDAELKAKEIALREALLLKEKEAAKRERVNKKKQAREAKRTARMAAAKRKAELTEKKRSAEMKAAEQKAELEREQAAAAARRQQELEAEQAEAAARLQVENARRKREQAEEAARRRAEDVIRKAQEEERRRAQEEDQEAQRRAMEEQAIQRAATELAHKPGLKKKDARVKTRIETPSMQRRSGGDRIDGKRKKQAGAPNLYSLRPFRNTPEIRDRATLSGRAMRLAYTVAAIALVVAAIVTARLATLPVTALPEGPQGMAIAPRDRLLLVAGKHLLLHDRSGASISQLPFDNLGIANLHWPLAFDQAGQLLAAGELSSATTPQPSPLLRCDLNESACEVFAPELAGAVISAITVHPTDGSLFVADDNAGELIRLNAEGSVISRASIELPPRPVLQLDSGLLLINSAIGPGISVYRYEANAFGKQLDEIILLPGDVAASERSRVTDFVRNGEYWWAILEQAQGKGSELYRFDSQWQFVDLPALSQGTRPAQLARWGGRTLVRDPTRLAVQRFSSSGAAEAPLLSTSLEKLLDEQENKSNLEQLGWRIALALSLLVAATGLCLGGLHRLRSLVYTSCRGRGAAPVDELADNIDWVDIAPDRAASFSRTGMGYLALATGLVLGTIGLGASSIQLAALLLALSGPAIALLLLQRSDPGHIGVSKEQLLLVDHSGMYHFDGGGRIHHRGPFLMIDDVTVFTGAPLLPAFSPAAIRERVSPIAAAGVKVDRKIVTVRLLQARHPLAVGVVVILATSASAIALLSLHGIF